MRVKTISAEKAHGLLRTDPAAVLVCAHEYWQDYRLEGAISLSDFRRRIASFPKDENIIFYCACPQDEMARQQAEKYRRRDFLNVRVLEGGVNAWKAAGYALVELGV
jgi:rhodanese-related sulfurtransferase